MLRIEEYEDTDVAMIQNLKDKDTSADSLNEDNGKKYILNFLTIFSTYAQLPFFFDFKEWIQMLFLFFLVKPV